MNSGEMIERMQEMHPGTSMNRIVKALNEAIRDFSVKTKVLTGTFTQNTDTTDGGVRYYELDPAIVEIISVDVDNNVAPKLVGRPAKRDIT